VVAIGLKMFYHGIPGGIWDCESLDRLETNSKKSHFAAAYPVMGYIYG